MTARSIMRGIVLAVAVSAAAGCLWADDAAPKRQRRATPLRAN